MSWDKGVIKAKKGLLAKHYRVRLKKLGKDGKIFAVYEFISSITFSRFVLTAIEKSFNLETFYHGAPPEHMKYLAEFYWCAGGETLVDSIPLILQEESLNAFTTVKNRYLYGETDHVRTIEKHREENGAPDV
jgi:hypothetical protein